MAYFTDLSPYTYFREPADSHIVNVGWLDAEEPYTRGDTSDEFRRALQSAATSKHTRGWHNCPLCPKVGLMSTDRGTCEIRVRHNGVTYAAPILIRHYVLNHDYRPPDVFIEAMLRGEQITDA